MTLAADEFIRRVLLHVLPKGLHRIRHYGLLASANRKADIARARVLLAVPAEPVATSSNEAEPSPVVLSIALARNPAGSCMGGFRTTAPAKLVHRGQPASENLHQRRRSC